MRSIRLNDAMDLQTTYPAANELGRRLERGAARPVALASGDFDEDGVPDLLSGYAGPGGGILALHRGNADSIYPNSPEAQQRKARGTFTGAPFLPPEQVFELPEAPELLATGDFNNDGHLDVVAAAHGSAALQLLSGDGRGKLGGAQRVELPGRVTALVTGEINRPDGLIDVIVGITGPAGPKVLVFESPEGILRGRPEAITLPAEATALALGELDEDFADLAVAAGRDLLIVHGHDHKPGFEEGSQFEVPHAAQSVAGETDPRGMSVSAMTQPRSSLPTGGTPVPRVSQMSFPFTLTSLAIGNFAGERSPGLAVLSEDGTVRLLTRGQGPEAVSQSGSFSGVSTAGQKQSKIEDWQPRELFRLSQSDRTRPPSLARAWVSGRPADDLILVDRIHRQLLIPAGETVARLQDEATIFAAPAPSSVPVSLNLDNEPVAVLPMRLNADALTDLVILESGTGGATVAVTAPAHIFTVNSTGDGPDSDTSDDICDDGTGDCTLRAAIMQANASAGADEIRFSIGSGVQTIAPASAFPEITDRVTIDGTTQPGFSGKPVIELSGATAEAGLVTVVPFSVIRGLVINRSDAGIALSIHGNIIIEGNFIGTDVTGTVAVGNGVGVRGAGSSFCMIGGTTEAARNLISGNGANLIIGGDARGNVVVGNLIGTDVTGSVALDSGPGISLDAARSNSIGGTTAAERNVITGSVSISRVAASLGNNRVQGNFIGTDVTGTQKLGDADDGVVISDSNFNTVSGNVISGRRKNGVVITGGLVAESNTVEGNLIGTDVSGTTPIGNGLHGILITSEGPSSGPAGNRIEGNTIAFNGGDGVFSSVGCCNQIKSNSIFSNGGLGIDLGPDGVTPNDPGDADSGPNDLQNFPVPSSATSSDNGTTIQGTLDSTPSTQFELEFFSNTACDPSGFGEGQTPLGSTTVTTDESGGASFGVTFSTAVPQGQFITATAIGPNRDTSEFSQCIVVQQNQAPEAKGRNVTASAGSNCAANASVDDGSSDPDGDPITMSQSPPGPYPLGQTSVTLTVTDNKGASSRWNGTVTVADATPPQVACSVNRTTLWPPDHRLIDVGFSYAATENCDPNPAISISVTSNEPGVFSPDAAFTEDAAGKITGLRLRAERKEDGHGRVYLIKVTATDKAGNSASMCSALAVPHDQSAASRSSALAQAAAAVAACEPLANNALVGEYTSQSSRK